MKPTIVLTRGAEDCARFARRLASRGFTSSQQPLLDIQPLPVEQIQLPDSISAKDLLIFVSVNAVLAGWPILQVICSEPPTCLAVGQRTGAALASFGISSSVPTREDSEGLLAMPSLQVLNGRRVFVVKGVGGRELITQTLTERGACVHEMSCYQRRYLPLSEAAVALELAPLAPLVWVASSGGMVEHIGAELARSAHPELKAQALVVPSVRVGLLASRLGWLHVMTAENAGDTAILKVLEQHFA